MDPLPAFLLSMILASIIIPRLGPFLSLVICSILFGSLVGMGPELLGYISSGLARMFSSLALVILGGAVLAEYLRKTGSLERIVSDLSRLAKRRLLVSGAAGFLISIPVMCSITAFMILEPVVRGLARSPACFTHIDERRALFLTAICSAISFNLIYPSPVMITLSSGLAASPSSLLLRAIPISLAIFVISCLIMLHIPLQPREALPNGQVETAIAREQADTTRISRLRAWFPLLLPVLLMLAGTLIEPDGGGDTAHLRMTAAVLSDPGLALLLGAMLGLAWQRDRAQELIHIASRRAGVILLDLCGAGAFGYVVSRSDLPAELFRQGQILPVLLLPFLLAAALQLAQGSRVVTAALAAQLLSGYPLPAETLALLIAAGAFMLSYVTDPFFWLVKNATASSLRETATAYTLPLSLIGLFVFVLAAVDWAL
ncbi:MAG TPA: hypothetical protein PLQ01_01825 [Methanothrix sp.]|nr:GntP family permease [Methanothrix sp.]HOV81396.1 hypothetical protein [Methanothrix sp.]HPC89741.1 hypothetical protein [Methanothrix sp.]HQI68568.1 hypothetical protein [Methanothrix sp.]HRS85027.1 hypothetical protein [Methanothrix sp.]